MVLCDPHDNFLLGLYFRKLYISFDLTIAIVRNRFFYFHIHNFSDKCPIYSVPNWGTYSLTLYFSATKCLWSSRYWKKRVPGVTVWCDLSSRVLIGPYFFEEMSRVRLACKCWKSWFHVLMISLEMRFLFNKTGLYPISMSMWEIFSIAHTIKDG